MTYLVGAALNFTIPQMMAHIRLPLYRNAYVLVLNQVVSAGLGVVYWMLAARLYPADVVGRNSALISTMVFISFLSQFDLKSAMTRFIPSHGRYAARLVASSYLITLFVAPILSLVFLFGLRAWDPSSGLVDLDPLLIAWFVLSATVWGIFNLQDGALIGLRRPIWVLIENTVYNVLKIVLLVALAGPLSRYGVFASWTLMVPILVVGVNAILVRRFIVSRVATTSQAQAAPPITVGQVAKFTAGNYAAAIFSETAVRLLPLLIIERLGSEANAYFYQSWIVAFSLYMVAANMATSLTVEANADRANMAAYSRRMLLQMARILVPVSVVMLIAAPYVLRLFGASYAREGAPLLRLLVVATIPTILNAWYIGNERARGRIKGIVGTQMVLCAMTLGLSSALLPIYGITGVGIAWLASQFVIASYVALSEVGTLRRANAETRASAAPSPSQLLRLVDWRALLMLTRAHKAVCFADERMTQAVALIADEVVDGRVAQASGCDLAVLVNPEPGTLKEAWRMLLPSGACYAEWRRVFSARPARIRREMTVAGFTDVRLYWKWPATGTPRFWLPLGQSDGPSHYVAEHLPLLGWLRATARLWLPGILRLGLWLGLMRPICLTARKSDESNTPSQASTDSSSTTRPIPSGQHDLVEVIEHEGRTSGAFTSAGEIAVLLHTPGDYAANKIVGLAFSGSARRPTAVIKLPRVSESTLTLTREASILHTIRSSDLVQAGQVPRLLFSLERGQTLVVAESALHGLLVSRLLNRATYGSLASSATDWLISLAGKTVPAPRAQWWDRLIEPTLQRFEVVYGSLTEPAMLDASRSILGTLEELPLVWEHRDFAPWNVLVDNGSLRVLDWDSAEPQGLPLTDLIYFLTHLTLCLEQGNRSRCECDAYGKMLDVTSFTGRVVNSCITRYLAATGIPPTSVRPLRLFTWMLHAGMDFQVIEGTLNQSSRSDVFCRSLYLALWREELQRTGESTPARGKKGNYETP